MDDHKLFVGNMAARITQRDLWRFFSPYGLIDECAKFHESYAFVRFVHAEDAQRARRETHGTILKGRKLKVEFAATANKSNPSSSSTDQSSNSFLFVVLLMNICNRLRVFIYTTTSPIDQSASTMSTSDVIARSDRQPIEL